MLNSQKITLRQSELRQRLGEISGLEGDDYTLEVREEEAALQAELPTLDARLRSAIISEDASEQTEAETPDAEARERAELRSKASLGNWFVAAAKGRRVDGAELEYSQAEGLNGNVPYELFETRAVSPAPSTVGVNLQSVLPAVFADSVAPYIGVSMPSAPSGVYAVPVITTSLSATALAKGAAATASAAAISVKQTTGHRVSARLEIALEDIAAIGTASFESALRTNLTMALSNQLDDYLLNGSGEDAIPSGILTALGNAPTAPTAVATFDSFAATAADQIDGVWAKMLGDISLLVGSHTYALASKTFQSASSYKGEVSAASYASSTLRSFTTTSRFAAPASNIQQALAYRHAKNVTAASCPSWGGVAIDDIYSGSAKGERAFTVHTLIGDVIVHYPDAYRRLSFKVA